MQSANDFHVLSDTRPETSLLDLFSTSPTLFGDVLEQPKRCVNNAPFFAYRKASKTFGVVQGSCNSWTCPRCGLLVAKEHYGRIVNGCRELAETSKLYFITITCRGKECSQQEAFDNYLKWTSKFLDACYAKAKRAKQKWSYVQVTEKQGRGHPHSHIITTFDAGDLEEVDVTTYSRNAQGELVLSTKKRLRSSWVANQVIASGLGEQYDISSVQSVEGASRYVAKYMFKSSQFSDIYPKHWKRVRYSQSFPKLPEVKTDAFVLLAREDWQRLAKVATVVDCYGEVATAEARYFLQGHDVIIEGRKEKGD